MAKIVKRSLKTALVVLCLYLLIGHLRFVLGFGILALMLIGATKPATKRR